MNILYPVFALFLLTLIVQLRLGALRFAAVRDGRIAGGFYRSYQGGEEPEDLRVHTRNLTNLYEGPVLFYTIVIIAYVTRQAGLLPAILAWGYVALRYAHSYVHLTSNRVLLRFRLFLASLAVLTALWTTVFVGMMLA